MAADTDELIQKFLDRIASSDELAELNRRIESDRDTAKAFVKAARYDSLFENSLRELMGRKPSCACLEAIESGTHRIPTSKRLNKISAPGLRVAVSRRRKSHQNDSTLTIWAALGAAAVILLIFALAQGDVAPRLNNQYSAERPETQKTVEPTRNESPGKSENVAKVTEPKKETPTTQKPLTIVENPPLPKSDELTGPRKPVVSSSQIEAPKEPEKTVVQEIAPANPVVPEPRRVSAQENIAVILGKVDVVIDEPAGPKSMLARNDARIPLEVGMEIREGDRIETANIGDFAARVRQNRREFRAAVELKNGATLDLAENTSLKFGQDRSVIARGQIYARVNPPNKSGEKAGQYGMVFETTVADFEMERGTFEMSVEPTRVALRVESGEGRFYNARGSQTVSSLHESVARLNTAPVATVPIAGATLWRGRFSKGETFNKDRLAFWYRADCGVELKGDRVIRWNDWSGHKINAEQTEPARQPIYQPRKDEPPLIHFDGTATCMNFNFPISGESDLTMVLVSGCSENFDLIMFSKRAALYFEETALWGDTYLTPLQGTVRWRFGTAKVQNLDILKFPRPLNIGNDLTLSVLRRDTATATETLFVNGKLALQIPNRTGPVAKCGPAAYLGRGNGETESHFPGEIAEVMVFKSALTPNERQDVERYLANKYKLKP